MNNVRNISSGTIGGIGGTHMAGDTDDEGFLAFNAIAQEAMKIERLVIQQSELKKKLEKMLAKSEKSKEKALDHQKLLLSDIQSHATKNRLLKDNVNGKRSTRSMVEQMTCDLERQLQLEVNDINNKKSGFLQVQHKYTEMWGQYEQVYLSSEEAKDMLQMRAARKEAGLILQKYKEEKENLICCKENTVKTQDAELGKLVIKFASLQNELKVLQDESDKTKNEMQTLSEEMSQKQQELQKAKDLQASKTTPEEVMEIDKLPTKPEATKAKSMSTSWRNRYKYLLVFNHITLPELELPTINQEDLGMFSKESDPEIACDYALGYDCIEEQELSLQSSVAQELSCPTTNELTMQENEPVEMVQEQTEMETESFPPEQDIAQQQQPQPDIPLDEPNQIEYQEICEETTPNQSTEIPETTANEQPACSEQLDEQPECSEQNSVEDPPQLEQSELMLEDEIAPNMESQGWEVDSCQGELMVAHGQMSCFTSSMSEVSEGSNFDLLDDAKRQAYLRKLMASPEFPLESHSVQSSMKSGQCFNQPMYHSYQQQNTETVSQVDQENLEHTSGEMNQDLNVPNHQAEVPQEQPCAPEQPNTLSSFAPMSSLFGSSFGQDQQQSQVTSEQSGFSFGGFSFGSSTNQNAVPANFFGGGSPFGDPSPTPKGSEAFNLNFDDKTNSSSIFKLF